METFIFDLQLFDGEGGGGTPPEGGGGEGGGGSSSSVSWNGATVYTSATVTSGQTYTSSTADENAVLISTTATVTLNDATVTKSGGTEASDNYSFYGINSAVMCMGGGTTSIVGGTITTDAAGANGIFSYGANNGTTNATGDGTTVYIKDVEITTSQQGSGGIMTTFGGTTYASDLTITTSGGSSAPIRTDRGGGWVYVNGGTYTSNGLGSPAIYSTADVNVSDATLTSTQSEGVCIEGAGSIALSNCNLTATNSNTNGNAKFYDTIMIYQSMSGDASEGTSVFTMTGGSLTSNNGHVFHVTNTSATINLNGVTINNNDSNGILLSVCDDGWSGNDNVATFNATDQTLTGTILVGDDSTLNLNLSGSSTFTGNISGTISNASGSTVSTEIGTVNVKLADDAKWYLTEDTYITDFDGNAANVISNGFTLYENGVAVDGTTSDETALNITNSDSNTLITGTSLNDTISNSGDRVTIDAAGGNDSIDNGGSLVSISAGAGDDSIISSGESVYIEGGEGNDTIGNGGRYGTIDAGDGDDNIMSTRQRSSISGGAGNDTITAIGANVTIDGGEGDDSISFTGDNVTIVTGAGNDSISGVNSTSNIVAAISESSIDGNNVILTTADGTVTLIDAKNQTFYLNGEETVFSGDGEGLKKENSVSDTVVTGTDYNDTIENMLAENVTINTSAGDDSIYNSSANVSIDAGAGADTITNLGANVSINAGDGDDSISNYAQNVTIVTGAGNDSISRIYSTTNIIATVSESSIDGNNVILTTADGTITIVDAKDQTFKLNGEDTVFSGETETTNTLATYLADFMLHKTEAGYPAMAAVAFHPTEPNPDAPTNYYSSETWTATSADDLTLSAVHYSPENPTGKWVILVHGYGKTGAAMNDFAAPYLAQGLDVLIVDQRAAGNSEGEWLTMGVAESADLAVWTQEIAKTNANAQITLHGVSMGAATVMLAAALSQITNVTAMIEDCGYGNISDVLIGLLTVYGSSLGVTGDLEEISEEVFKAGKTLSGYNVANAAPINSIANVTVPSLFIHGNADTAIPVSNAQNLYNASGASDKTLLTIEGAGHAESGVVDSATYLTAAMTLINNSTSEIGADINSTVDNKNVRGTIYDDDIKVFGYNDTIDAGAGADKISVTGENISIDAGEGNNTVEIYSSFYDTIISGSGDDSISVGKGDHLSISSGEGKDSIIGTAFGIEDDDWSFGGYATVDAGAGNDYIAPFYSDNSSINAGDGDDTIINNGANTTIDAGAGNDYIEITNNATDKYETAVINAGDGADTISVSGENTTIDGGAGNDSITAIEADKISINAGDGDNYVFNAFAYYDEDGNFVSKYTFDENGNLVSRTNKNSKQSTAATILGGSGNDTLVNQGIDNAKVDAGEGNNFIGLYHSYYNTITTGSGNDSVVVDKGHYVNVSTGAGDDSIIGRIGTVEADSWAFGGHATIDAGAGNDYIAPIYSNDSSIYGGDGNDTIINNGQNTTIDGGAGNDYIELTNNYEGTSKDYEPQVIIASAGNDTITGVQSNTQIQATVIDTSISDNNVILTTNEGTLTLANAKGQKFLLNGISTIYGGSDELDTKTILAGEFEVIDGVKYTAVDADAVLNLDSDSKVTGIASGKVEATINEAETTPTITLDGATTFDFTATGSTDNGLNIKVGNQSITYVAGKATYTADKLTFAEGELKLKSTASTFSTIMGTIVLNVPAGGLEINTGSKNFELNLTNELVATFQDSLLAGSLKLSGKISRNGEDKTATLSEGAKLISDHLTIVGTEIDLNFGITANKESVLAIDGMTLIVKDGSDLNITGTSFGIEGDMAVSGGDLSFGLLSLILNQSLDDLKLSPGATLQFTPKNLIPLTITGAEDSATSMSIKDKIISVTTSDDKAISIKFSGVDVGTLNIIGTVALDTENQTITINKDTKVKLITASGVTFDGVANEDVKATLSVDETTGAMTLKTSDGASLLQAGSNDTNTESFTVSVINAEGETLLEDVVVSTNGEFTFGEDNTITVAKDSTLNATFADGHSISLKATDDAGGKIEFTEDGIQFTPNENDGNLELSVTRDGETRTASLEVTGTVTYQFDGDISLAQGTVVKNVFEDGNVLTITANTDASGTIHLDAEDGLKITPATADALGVVLQSGDVEIFDITSISGEISYKGGVITASDGSEVRFTNYYMDSEMALKTNGGTSSLKIDEESTSYIANEGATFVLDYLDGTTLELTSGTFTDDYENAIIATAGVTFKSNDDEAPFIIKNAGTYTLNDNTVITTEDNVAVYLSNYDTVEFDIGAAVDYSNYNIEGESGNAIQLTQNIPSVIMYKQGTVNIEGSTFTLTEDDADGIKLSSAKENEFSVSRVISEDEIEKYGVEASDVGKVFEEVVEIFNDETFSVQIAGNGIKQIDGLSNGAEIANTAIFDGEVDPNGNYFYVSTDSEGSFKFGANTYEISQDDNVTLKIDFDKNGDGTVKEISDLDGSFEGKVSESITINGTEIGISEESEITALADGNDIIISGVADGAEVTTSKDNVNIVMTGTELTLNEVTYKTTGDSDGVIIGNNEVSGLDADAKLIISKAGNYTVNHRALQVGEGDTVIGVNNNYAYVYDENELQYDSNTSTQDILDDMGIASDNVTTLTDDTDENVSLDNQGKNAAVVSEDASGKKSINLGNGGNAAIIEETSAPVTVTGGKGDDTIVTQGQNVVVDMSSDGTDKVIATGGKVTLDNYNPAKDSGIKLTVDDMKDGIKLDGGKVSLSNAQVTFGDGNDNFVNLYDIDDNEMKVGFATENNRIVDASGSSEDLILIGGGDSLENPILRSSLIGGSGNDTIYSGERSYVDAGSGNNYVVMSDKGDAKLNYSTGKTTVDNFNFVADGVDSDKLQTGNVGINTVKVADDDVVIQTSNGNIQINDAAGKNIRYENDYTNGEVVIQFGDDELNLNEDATFYWAAGKNATVSLDEYAQENATVNLNNTDFTNKDQFNFYGGVKNIDASEFEGKAVLIGDSDNNAIAASKDGSTLYGGAGNDTFIGGDGADEFRFDYVEGRNLIKDFETGTGDNADVIQAGNSAISTVKVKDDEDVVMEFGDSTITLEGAAGETIQFTNQYTGKTIEMQVGYKDLTVNDEANFYWAAGKNATVSLAEYEGESANIDLSNSNFSNEDQISFYGDIKAINATGYENKATLYGNNNDNIITAGKDDSTLWGGNGGNDTLIGGDGDDVFFYTNNNGNDVIQNAGENDTVKLFGVSISDLVSTDRALFAGNNVKMNFNDGGSLTVKDAKTSGVTFEFGDGTQYVVQNGKWDYK